MFKLRQLIKSDFCKKCFGCCRFKEKESIWIPKLLEEETYLLKIKKIKLEFKEEIFICSFLKIDSNLCKIYKKRPFECRLYPFLIESKNSNLFLSLHKGCPFIRNSLDSKSLQNYINYLNKFLKKSYYLSILIKNKSIFSSYPQEETIKLNKLV
ncbi:MAG: YkgJ family cysteine cluster protein [Candidatus Omnitrophica bacterium]|nr:YkgJ family cysteine cluster protein [Candidatus Omnitrophota bacterium]